MLKGRENLLKLALMLTIAVGLYLIVAWASYSPLDNAWSVSNSANAGVLNRTGTLGAVAIDLLLAMFGHVSIFIPTILVFTSAYLLLLKRTSGLDVSQILFWLMGFSLLILGLCGLFSVLLTHTAYYLSGGFLGGLLNRLFEHMGGQITVLLVAMVSSSVGLYLCSVQILIQLFNRLYQWIFEPKTAMKVEEKSIEEIVREPLSHTPDFMRKNELSEVEPIETEEVSENNPSSPSVEKVVAPLVNIENFVPSTPRIYGLPSSEPIEEVSPETTHQQAISVPITAPYPITQTVHDADSDTQVLPVVQVKTPEVENISIFEQPQKISTSFDITVPVEELETAMPTVRLNPIVAKSNEQAEEKVVETAKKSFEVASHSEPPSVKIEPVKEVNLTNVESQPAPVTYGNSLIHPLLQKNRILEKPSTPLPTLDLLTHKPAEEKQITREEINTTSARIEQELANFGIKVKVEDVLIGPVVTRYEIRPAAGVKASKISSLDSDLMRALMFESIRITDFVPGKPYMGIETPNLHRETVWLHDVLASDAFQHSKATLPMALGKDISGQPIVIDMQTMPHLLVAGQTGSGKSVGVNTMILSLLYKRSPDELRFIMIDPKSVEFTMYRDIPHLLTPVVTDPKKAENALRWAIEEMERRYRYIESLETKNIEGYNQKIQEAVDKFGYPIPDMLWLPGDTMDSSPPPLEKMSYIVIVIDELADLMMVAGKQIEEHIIRLTQKARAAGIHLIVATQRPSTDVITGLIKTNIPSRIGFRVASYIDSRTILDQGGAEKLLGRGDMLYRSSSEPTMVRIHGAYMTDEDVQRVADNWRARAKPKYISKVIEAREDEFSENKQNNGGGDLDPLFDDVVQFVLETGETSTSMMSRRFSVGYNRAARIMEQLEREGIVSAPDKRKRREIITQ